VKGSRSTFHEYFVLVCCIGSFIKSRDFKQVATSSNVCFVLIKASWVVWFDRLQRKRSLHSVNARRRGRWFGEMASNTSRYIQLRFIQRLMFVVICFKLQLNMTCQALLFGCISQVTRHHAQRTDLINLQFTVKWNMKEFVDFSATWKCFEKLAFPEKNMFSQRLSHHLCDLIQNVTNCYSKFWRPFYRTDFSDKALPEMDFYCIAEVFPNRFDLKVNYIFIFNREICSELCSGRALIVGSGKRCTFPKR